MIKIEPIIKRNFSQADRATLQDQVCAAVEADPERFLYAYRLDSRSFQGRYVNSDLMKEVFPEYPRDIAIAITSRSTTLRRC